MYLSDDDNPYLRAVPPPEKILDFLDGRIKILRREKSFTISLI